MPARRILVTSALPYANGQIHVGHLLEYLQTDIWVRFQKMRGNVCRYFCADDTHGTAIMLRARQEGVRESELIERMSAAHQRDFAGFGIEFDHYGSTHSDSNRELCQRVWRDLVAADLVAEKQVMQLFDTQEGVFLADRFVQGNCPNCDAPEQYGDNCERCSATYTATQLKNPRSALSGATPELRSAIHYCVRVESLHPFLDAWTQEAGRLQPEIAHYLKGFFLGNPLRDWDVSRPAPYFGFEIPDHRGHYWYVWFDAPIGYLAATRDWCGRSGERWEDWWESAAVEITHFIGKDIVYFHALFWPVMLRTAGFQLPRRLQVHGMLTVNGEKMSKSRGTSILASTYLAHLNPAYLRYYYATRLTAGVDDVDLDLGDLVQKVNSDLVGKVVNLASRSIRFIQDVGLSPAYPDDHGLFQAGVQAGTEIAAAYEACDYARAMRLIMGLADRANEYIDREQPWGLRKVPGSEERIREICTVCLNLYRQVVVYLAPVLPRLASESSTLLHADTASWSDAATPTLGHAVGPFEPLLTRVERTQVDKLLASPTPDVG